jgi:DNA polymerase-3 subunit delta
MAKEGVTIRDFREELRRGILSPVYLFFGQEDFLVEETVEAVIDAALKPEERGFNLDVVQAGETDARDIVSHASSFPMMANRRVVVARDVDKLQAKDLEILSAYVENPSPSTVLVLVAAKPDLRKRPFVTVKRTGFVLELKPLYENQLPVWITERIERQGRKISPEACRLMAGYVGTSLREITSEIEKLFLYLGDRRSISADDVAAVVGMSREFSVFELQKAAGARDLPRALHISERMIDAGENVPFILIMLTGYFNVLWKLQEMRRRGIPEREQTSTLRVNPYFLKDYVEAVGRFTNAELEESFCMLAAADEQLKTTGTDPRQIMHSLLINLLREEGTWQGH